MKRHYYISQDLDDLKAVEKELTAEGISVAQYHVLSQQDAEVEKHRLHEVESMMRKDIIHSTKTGAIVGAIAAVLVLVIAYVFNLTESRAGWIPFIFLAIVLLGFCTWEGGLKGIQEPHFQFKHFKKALDKGHHVFFVDIDPDQETTLKTVIQNHPHLHFVSVGAAVPRWLVVCQNKWRALMAKMP